MYNKSSAVRGSTVCRFASALILACTLAGCAGAKVSNVQSTIAVGKAPTELLVEVNVASNIGAGQQKDVSRIRSELESALVKRLVKSGVTAEPLAAGTHDPDAAVLHVSITDAESGNLAKRMIVGLGWGKARLQAQADLERVSASGGQPVTTFDTASDSGMKPGLLIPGGVAAATGNMIGLAIGGTINIARNIHGGMSKPIKSTSVAIVDQLKKCYQTAGWTWPSAKQKA